MGKELWNQSVLYCVRYRNLNFDLFFMYNRWANRPRCGSFKATVWSQMNPLKITYHYNMVASACETSSFPPRFHKMAGIRLKSNKISICGHNLCIYNECVISICSFKISKQLRVGNRLHGYNDLVSKIPIHLCNYFGGHKFIVWFPTSQHCLIQMRLSQWLRIIYLNNVIHCWCNESNMCAIDISHLKALIFWAKIAWKNEQIILQHWFLFSQIFFSQTLFSLALSMSYSQTLPTRAIIILIVIEW